MATLFHGSFSGLMYTLIDAAVKAALLLVMVTIIAVLLRRASASFRHMTWALGLACTLCLPLLSQNLPHWRVPVTALPTHSRPAAREAPPLADAAQPKPPIYAPVVPRTKASVPSAAALPRGVAEPTVAVQPPAPLPDLTAHPPAASAPQVSWTTLLLLVWLSGSVLMLAQLAQGVLKVRRIVTTSASLIFGPIAGAAAKAMSVGRHVTLRLASSPGQVMVPFTYGMFRPVIVLPAEATQWPEERLRAALLHEMAHVRRHDWSLQVMGHIARALYWFNPLVWVATRRLRAESEAAADDLVLSVGMPAPEYARHLLDVALAARHSRRVSQGAVAMAQSPKVEERLRAVLAQGLSRRPVTWRAAAGFLAVAVLVALPLAALRLAAHGEAVPAAERLQLRGDFTLRYAVTVSDKETTQAQFHEYQQLRADYQRELGKDPYLQPVPPEFYAPFSYFQSRRPRNRHLVLTVSAQGGKLLWRSEENGHTFALVYNGKDGTQLFSDGHAGRVEPGLQFPEMANCPLPAVGLPHIPLLKGATLINSSATEQTWQAEAPLEGAEIEQGKALYTSARAHAVNAEGIWKVLDVDSSDQRFQFLQHRRFQGLWVASHMTLTKYTTANLSTNSRRFSSEEEFIAFIAAHRTPTSVCDYRLLSASGTPLEMSTLGMRSATVPMPALQSPSLDDREIQEALHLRFHLQDWALSHEATLRRMERATSSDFSAASAVDQSLRALPFPLWQGGGISWDGDPRVGHGSQKPLFTAEGLRQPSGNARDFVIARSHNSAVTHVWLWASGRITRVTASIKGQEEIVPPFFGTDGTSNMAGDGPEASLNASAPPLAPQLKPAVGFRRYTSPPLLDGTRYTFLYPSYYANVHQGWLDSDHQFGSVRIDCIGTKPVPWIAAKGQTPISYYSHGKQGGAWLSPHEEFCSVVVGNAAPPLWQGPHPLEIDHQWVGENGSHHDFSIKDAHTRYRFEVIHEDRYTPALFRQTDPVIVGSFRVLPPGASVPKLPPPAIETARTTMPPAKRGGDTAVAHIALGQKLQQQGQPRDGIPEFRRAVQIDPNDAVAQEQLAQALYEIKWKHFKTPARDTTVSFGTPPAVLDEAILHMRRAVALRPNDARWHSTLGTYLSNRGRHREAVAEYRHSMHLMPPLSPADIKPSTDGSIPGNVAPWYDAYWTLGEELVQTGHYQEAVTNLRQALRFNPSSDSNLLWLGDALNGSGHRPEARAAWKKSLAAKPSNSYYQGQARARLARY